MRIWQAYGIFLQPISIMSHFIYGAIIIIVRQYQRYMLDTDMMTSSNWNIFRVTGHLCGEFTGPRWIPRTKASDAELWCFFDLRLNKRSSKQSWGWCFDTLSRPLWRHGNGTLNKHSTYLNLAVELRRVYIVTINKTMRYRRCTVW